MDNNPSKSPLLGNSREDRLVEIFMEQISIYIEEKWKNYNQIDKNIELCKERLDRVRKEAVQKFYMDQYKGQEADQPSIHPAVQKLIGKRPVQKLETDESLQWNVWTMSRETRKNTTNSFVPEPKNSNRNSEGTNLVNPRYIPPSIPGNPQENSASRGNARKMHMRVLVGNVAKPVANNSQDPVSHKWMVYVRSAPGSLSVDKEVSKVRFFLHSSYKPDDVITVPEPPFTLHRRGWGEFSLKVQLCFKNHQNKSVDIIHKLQLTGNVIGHTVRSVESFSDMWIYPRNSDPVASTYNDGFEILHQASLLLKEPVPEFPDEARCHRCLGSDCACYSTPTHHSDCDDSLNGTQFQCQVAYFCQNQSSSAQEESTLSHNVDPMQEYRDDENKKKDDSRKYVSDTPFIKIETSLLSAQDDQECKIDNIKLEDFDICDNESSNHLDESHKYLTDLPEVDLFKCLEEFLNAGGFDFDRVEQSDDYPMDNEMKPHLEVSSVRNDPTSMQAYTFGIAPTLNHDLMAGEVMPISEVSSVEAKPRIIQQLELGNVVDLTENRLNIGKMNPTLEISSIKTDDTNIIQQFKYADVNFTEHLQINSEIKPDVDNSSFELQQSEEIEVAARDTTVDGLMGIFPDKEVAARNTTVDDLMVMLPDKEVAARNTTVDGLMGMLPAKEVAARNTTVDDLMGMSPDKEVAARNTTVDVLVDMLPAKEGDYSNIQVVPHLHTYSNSEQLIPIQKETESIATSPINKTNYDVILPITYSMSDTNGSVYNEHTSDISSNGITGNKRRFSSTNNTTTIHKSLNGKMKKLYDEKNTQEDRILLEVPLSDFIDNCSEEVIVEPSAEVANKPTAALYISDCNKPSMALSVSHSKTEYPTNNSLLNLKSLRASRDSVPLINGNFYRENSNKIIHNIPKKRVISLKRKAATPLEKNLKRSKYNVRFDFHAANTNPISQGNTNSLLRSAHQTKPGRSLLLKNNVNMAGNNVNENKSINNIDKSALEPPFKKIIIRTPRPMKNVLIKSQDQSVYQTKETTINQEPPFNQRKEARVIRVVKIPQKKNNFQNKILLKDMNVSINSKHLPQNAFKVIPKHLLALDNNSSNLKKIVVTGCKNSSFPCKIIVPNKQTSHSQAVRSPVNVHSKMVLYRPTNIKNATGCDVPSAQPKPHCSKGRSVGNIVCVLKGQSTQGSSTSSDVNVLQPLKSWTQHTKNSLDSVARTLQPQNPHMPQNYKGGSTICFVTQQPRNLESEDVKGDVVSAVLRTPQPQNCVSLCSKTSLTKSYVRLPLPQNAEKPSSRSSSASSCLSVWQPLKPKAQKCGAGLLQIQDPEERSYPMMLQPNKVEVQSTRCSSRSFGVKCQSLESPSKQAAINSL